MVYNGTMHDQPVDNPTVKDVARFVTRNLHHIDMERLAADFERCAWITRAAGVKTSAFVAEQLHADPSFALRLIRQRVVACKNVPLIIAEMKAERKVPAIKLIREAFGIGLKEAKDIADHLHDETFIRFGTPKVPYNCSATFDEKSKAAFDEIMEQIDE